MFIEGTLDDLLRHIGCSSWAHRMFVEGKYRMLVEGIKDLRRKAYRMFVGRYMMFVGRYIWCCRKDIGYSTKAHRMFIDSLCGFNEQCE